MVTQAIETTEPSVRLNRVLRALGVAVGVVRQGGSGTQEAWPPGRTSTVLSEYGRAMRLYNRTSREFCWRGFASDSSRPRTEQARLGRVQVRV